MLRHQPSCQTCEEGTKISCMHQKKDGGILQFSYFKRAIIISLRFLFFYIRLGGKDVLCDSSSETVKARTQVPMLFVVSAVLEF
jgi:hypothetical protein